MRRALSKNKYCVTVDIESIDMKSSKTEKITEQILQECREIFDAELSLIRKYDDKTREVMPAGIPEEMLIADFKSNTRSLNKIRKGKNSGEFVKAWIYRDGVTKPVMMVKEPDKGGEENVFFRQSYARFAYSEEKKILYLNVFYSPRYVKGWYFHLIESDTGLKLGESCLKWLY